MTLQDGLSIATPSPPSLRLRKSSTQPFHLTAVAAAAILLAIASLSPVVNASPIQEWERSTASLSNRQFTSPTATTVAAVNSSSADFTGISNMGAQKMTGLILAIGSSLAIGTSFIITKRGLMDAAERGGMANASEGHSYLNNPIWWAGMLTMVIGEVANFAAYTYAPPILVTPLGALSVLIGAVLASFVLKEELGRLGRVGCSLCLVGTVIIVVNAPEDKEIQTVDEILNYALQTPFLTYCLFVLVFAVWMIWRMVPKYGRRTPLVYLSICSLVGSISVMSVKGFGVALKLTFDGNNQFTHPSTYCFAIVVVVCILVQMNYFNKALDQFSTNIVNPIYYVMFTTSTIFASFLLFRGFNTNGAAPAVSLLGGFIVIFMGVYLLNLNRIIDPVTQQPRMSLVTGEGISGTGRLSESHERLMGAHRHGDGVFQPRLSMSGRRDPGRNSMALADQYWAAAAGGGSSGAASMAAGHSRRGSNGSVLFNAYDDLDDEGGPFGHDRSPVRHHVLGHLEEEDDDPRHHSGNGRAGSNGYEDSITMSPLGGGARHARNSSVARAQSHHHRRSASLKSVVGTNGRVIPGATSSAANSNNNSGSGHTPSSSPNPASVSGANGSGAAGQQQQHSHTGAAAALGAVRSSTK